MPTISGNRISGNYIGTDVTGSVAMGNQGGADGVDINANPGPASGNFVGWDGVGDPTLMRNIISGFTGSTLGGVNMVVGAQGNVVAGNYIGIGATGAPLGNGQYGISMDYATANTLAARNWIAGQGTAIRFFGSGGFEAP
ncbi:MAG TPA: hypothetical protein VLK26_04560 [Rudaea sp.]|nr:hypothetical protein [Rudaea sp.]